MPRHRFLIADGDYGGVQALEITSKPQVTYNLTVVRAHTFGMGTPADRQSELHPPSLHEAGSEIAQILGGFGRDLCTCRTFDRRTWQILDRAASFA
jgi:hypothetical protein